MISSCIAKNFRPFVAGAAIVSGWWFISNEFESCAQRQTTHLAINKKIKADVVKYIEKTYNTVNFDNHNNKQTINWMDHTTTFSNTSLFDSGSDIYALFARRNVHKSNTSSPELLTELLYCKLNTKGLYNNMSKSKVRELLMQNTEYFDTRPNSCGRITAALTSGASLDIHCSECSNILDNFNLSNVRDSSMQKKPKNPET
jgi:hypothetical protein